MSELSRSQLAVYGAVAVALLLLGTRAIAQGSDEQGDPEATVSAGEQGSSSGGFEVSEAGGRDVVVHVAGAVVRPGVYRLPSGARVTDAVERAGGGTGKAMLDAVNLAARLADGQQIVVPQRVPGGGGAAGLAAGASTDGPISLGSASLEQLDTIEGIGPVTAQKILEFRDQNGGLSSIEQLDEVSGIGPATMEALRDRLQP